MPENPASAPEGWPPPWAKRIREFASQVVPKNFSGSVTLNFSEGGSTRVQMEISFK